jgi:hypothetical protein
MLNAKMLSVDILRVVISYAGCHYAEYLSMLSADCHYSESINANCNYVKCRYTVLLDRCCGSNFLFSF